jgi:hypothetical protein
MRAAAPLVAAVVLPATACAGADGAEADVPRRDGPSRAWAT